MVNSFLKTDLWGALLQHREVAEQFSAPAMLNHMLRFERAWTQALLTAGRVSEAQAEAADAAMGTFRADFDRISTGSERDGLPLPALVAQIKDAVAEDVWPAVHAGSTSQDVLDTSMVLASREVFGLFEHRLGAICGALTTLNARFGANPLMGRTRMQAALPISVGQRIDAWRGPIERSYRDLPELMDRSAVVQLGGAVGDRAFAQNGGERIVETIAARLGLQAGDVWHSDRDRFADMGHWMTKLAGACAKIGMDVALMAQQGLDEIRLSGAGVSSAMPHKQNPVRAETLVALGRYVAGQNAILGQSLIHEQERSGAAWTLEWLTLPAMCEATGVALTTTQVLLEQIEYIGSPD